MRALLASIVLAAALAACGGPSTGDGLPDAAYDCTTETRADMFSAGMMKAGSQGKLTFKLMSSTPAPPARGNNDWSIAIVDAVSGAPVAGAAMTVVPFMPDHNHGTSIKPTITDQGAGMYDVDPVNLWMPGLWQVTVTATPSGGTLDKAVFSFCIPG
jgi:YtkA-like